MDNSDRESIRIRPIEYHDAIRALTPVIGKYHAIRTTITDANRIEKNADLDHVRSEIQSIVRALEGVIRTYSLPRSNQLTIVRTDPLERT